MADAYDVILTRRSIRRFKTDRIAKDILQKIITAGFFAPSSDNLQPCHFVIVDDREQLNTMMKIHPYMTMLATAPYALVVCADISISAQAWPIDCAAATENILLAATAMGIGSCWCGIYSHEPRSSLFCDLLGLPEQIRPFCAVALGYPDEVKDAPHQYLPQRVHYNQF